MDGYEEQRERERHVLDTVDYEKLKEAYWRRKAEKDEPERLRREEAIRQRREAALTYLNTAFKAFAEVNFGIYNLPPLDEHQASLLVDLIDDYRELS